MAFLLLLGAVELVFALCHAPWVTTPRFHGLLLWFSSTPRTSASPPAVLPVRPRAPPRPCAPGLLPLLPGPTCAAILCRHLLCRHLGFTAPPRDAPLYFIHSPLSCPSPLPLLLTAEWTLLFPRVLCNDIISKNTW